MKTISSRFLKGGLAVLLAVLMLCSSCISGFAAVVDNADTSANVDVAETAVNHTGGYIYFLKPSTWTASKVMMFVGHSSYTSVYEMTKVANTDNLYRYTQPSWGGATYVAFANAGSLWGSGSWGPSNRTNATHYTNVYNNYGYNSGAYYVHVPASTSNNAGLTINYKGTAASTINLTTTANVYVSEYGANSYTSNAAGGTVSLSGYYMSAYNTASSRSASSSASNASASNTFAPGSTVKFTAAANPGYTFKGWYSNSACTTLVSSSATYNYAYDISYTGKTLYAAFEKDPVYYTVDYVVDGETVKTEQVIEGGYSTGAPTVADKEGHTFSGWDKDPATTVINANTTFTASFTPHTYSVSFDANGGTGAPNAVTKTYGVTLKLPTTVPTCTGYDFAGWNTAQNGSGTSYAAGANYTANAGATLYAQWTPKTYTLTYSEEYTEGGTVTVGGNVIGSGEDITYNDNITVGIVAPIDFKIATVSVNGTETAVGSTSYEFSHTVTGDLDIVITYEDDGSCSISFPDGFTSADLLLGEEYYLYAECNSFCSDWGNIRYESSNSSVVELYDEYDGTFAACGVGTATITAHCDTDGTSAVFTVRVLAPALTTVDYSGKTINSVFSAADDLVITNEPLLDYSYSYSLTSGSSVTVTEDGEITAVRPGTSTVTVTLTCGDYVTSKTFSVSVVEPVYDVAIEADKLLVGQNTAVGVPMNITDDYDSVEFTTTDTDVIELDGQNVTAIGAGEATITATFTIGSYTKTATCTVSVKEPTITADPAEVTLEYNAEHKLDDTKTVTITTNASEGNGQYPGIAVSVEDDSVATASYDAETGELTVTAQSIGSTTVTLTYLGKETTVDVNVEYYDPYVYVYFTNDWNWSRVCVHAWVDGGADIAPRQPMTKIGTHKLTSNGVKDVYAYKFEKDNMPNRLIFADITTSGTWNNKTPDIVYDGTVDGYSITWANNANQTLTYDFIDARSDISAEDIRLAIGQTSQMNVTPLGDYTPSEYAYAANPTGIATITGNTADASVKGDAAGTTEVTVTAYAQLVPTLTNNAIGLQTVEKTDAAKEYVAKTTTATVEVLSTQHTVSAEMVTTDDGTYTDTVDVQGGTVETSFTNGDLLDYGTSITLTAVANDSYAFDGWYVDGEQVSENAEYATTVSGDVTYVARFIKQYNIGIVVPEGVASVNVNDTTYTESQTLTFNAGEEITVTATAAENFKVVGFVRDGENTDATTVTVSALVADTEFEPLVVETKVASAQVYTNKSVSTAGGSATVNGEATFNASVGEALEFVAAANDDYTFLGWYDAYSDTELTTPVSTATTYNTTQTADGVHLVALFAKNYYYVDGDGAISAMTYNLEDNSYSISTAYSENAFSVTTDAQGTVDADLIVGKSDCGNITAADGAYTFALDTVNYYDSENVTYTLSMSGTGKYQLTATAVAKPRYEVNLAEGTVGALQGADSNHTYAVGAQVVIKLNIDSTMYLVGATSDVEGVDFVLDESLNTITFTMPESDITVGAVYDDKHTVDFTSETGLTIENRETYGYKPGTENIEITVSPVSESYVIQSLTSNNDAAVITPNEDGTYTITIAVMPDENITITPAISASFAMNADVKTVGAMSTAVGGTIAMTVAGEDLANGTRVPQGTVVTYTAAANDGYDFIGFFSDADCTKLVSRSTEIEYIPTDATTLYALYAKTFYIIGDVTGGKWEIGANAGVEPTYQRMSYSYKDKAYTFEFNGTAADFKVANGAYSTWGSSNATIDGNWNDFHTFTAGSFTVNFNKDSEGVTIAWDTDNSGNYVISKAETGFEGPTTIYVEPLTGQSSTTKYGLNVWAQATQVGATVYLSSGKSDLAGYKTADLAEFSTSSMFVDPDFSVTTEQTLTRYADASNQNAVSEKYVVGTMTKKHTVTVQTTISGTKKDDYYVDTFVVYNIDSKTFETYTGDQITSMGFGRYSCTIEVTEDCYIVPIYFHSDAYLKANNVERVYIYADTSVTNPTSIWGPFISAYAWGQDAQGNNIDFLGGWTGQMMIPTTDGSQFYTILEVAQGEELDGVTFNNNIKADYNGTTMTRACTVPAQFASDFELTSFNGKVLNPQTYDYKEPIYLYEQGYSAITFTLKTTTDGYHGDYPSTNNANNTNNVQPGEAIDITEFDFDYLYNRDGVTHMDFRAQDIPNQKATDPASFYVVAKGDIVYENPGFGTEDYKCSDSSICATDETLEAQWAVDWYIYDVDGSYITKVVSGALYDDISTDEGSQLERALAAEGYDVAGKTVKISYEYSNAALHDATCDTTGSCTHGNAALDGQWYGNLESDIIKADVKVVLDDKDNGTFTVADDNEEDYGKAYLEGFYQSYDYTYADNIVNLSAMPLVDANGTRHIFTGWYQITDDGEYLLISESYNYSTVIMGDTRFYAIFEPLSEDALLVTHQPYVNYTDTEILSHNGIASMGIEIYAYDAETETVGDLLAKGDESTALSQAAVNITEGDSVLVKIITTPQNQGSFYAWYTDSTTADGTATYEEIATDGSHIDSTTTVSTEFVYTCTDTSDKVINIYSDVTRVSNYATLIYKYINRFGEWRTYTVQDVLLTDEECLGYDGNESQPYVPTYKTAYTMSKEGEDDVVVYGEGDYETFIALGYKESGSFNQIQHYAPKPNVTQVFDEQVAWTIADVRLTYQKSLITLVADQVDNEYTINYEIDGEISSVSGLYNTLASIKAPETNSAGVAFSYWTDADGHIISYSRFYNYRIVEDKDIVAVYEGEIKDAWMPIIDSVTITREYQDTSDYIYTDYLLTFSNSEDKVLDDVKAEENIKYGLILLRDPSVLNQGANNTFVDVASVGEGNVKNVALGGNHARVNGADGNTYNAYCYNLTNEDTTIFNRLDYFLKYDNNNKNSYKDYNFTAVAYIIVDGEVILSESVDVNFYKQATAPVTDVH